jgi:3-(3-hydroxy-phenyl)propionate hydroxylase
VVQIVLGGRLKRAIVSINDAIIVGAGPSGLVCAMHLAKAGFRIKILESEPEIPQNLRGSTFHPSSLDMLETAFGAATPLINQGLISPTVQFRRHGKGKIAEFDFKDIEDLTHHPFRLQAEQYKLCFILREMLADYTGAEIIYNAKVTAVRQNADTAQVTTNDGNQEHAARYLVGADGADSIVRRALNIPFEGFTWPERFLVVSTPFDFSSVFTDLSSVSYFADSEEWYFLLKIPGRLWRAMFPTEAVEKDETVLSDERVQARMTRVHDKGSPYAVTHKTLYNVHQRIARTYRVGRIVLTGDAAHINNPLGGMGMNGGIHDSFNLAEKLIPVLKGKADPAILDNYSDERRNIAMQYVQKISIQNKNDLEAKEPAEQLAFERRLIQAEHDLTKRRHLLLRLSMLASLGKTS